ncbi:ROK family protein [Bradymonas sediminis]|uniref:ROK family protein n=1 Tax=Bradymonas sediminis TaxID=1548548 RepID=A0A2Z4FQS9_9DELT|nr:ROK family protein [Bradymonas sediminis]AWV91125.1 ROK family protein [Bradymonas sediminis]TDP73681.1 glucokinase [Bradymonas sediminis]
MKGFAGFDIGGTNARVRLYGKDWRPIAEQRRLTRGAAPEAVVETMCEMLLSACKEAGIAPGTLASVGVGIAAQLDRSGQTVLNAPNLGWRNVPFGAMLREALQGDLGAPKTRMVNDLNAILWGEHSAGAVRDAKNVLAVYVGTGVGGAILTDGRLFFGAGGNAGEIGHSKVSPGGLLCGCGERGCVEAYAGGLHLEQRAVEIATYNCLEDVLREGDGPLADLEAADQLAASGEPHFDKSWQIATDYLAVVIANACTLLNPSVLLLGGGVLDNLADFRARLLGKIPALVLETARDDLEIRSPELGDDAGVLGAARLAAEFGR